jgi:hypothetical protein
VSNQTSRGEADEDHKKDPAEVDERVDVDVHHEGPVLPSTLIHSLLLTSHSLPTHSHSLPLTPTHPHSLPILVCDETRGRKADEDHEEDPAEVDERVDVEVHHEDAPHQVGRPLEALVVDVVPEGE